MPTGAETWHSSDGKSVHVSLLYAVLAKQVAVVDGILGITVGSGESGEEVALTIDDREYQFTVPAALAVAKGAIVYVDITDLTGHTPDDSAYSTTAGANKVALFKAMEAKDSNNVVLGKLLAGNYAP